MSLTRWRPMLDPFEEMEEMMGRFFPSGSNKSFMPAVDVYEEGGNVVVEAPLAGVSPKEVEINVQDGLLTIKGESKKEHEVDDKNYYRKEVRMGSFFRQVALPTKVKEDNVSAEFKDGVLKVICPKEEPKKANKVEIIEK